MPFIVDISFVSTIFPFDSVHFQDYMEQYVAKMSLYIWMQIFNGVFLKVNKATVNMLHRVEPYVTYGYDQDHYSEQCLS